MESAVQDSHRDGEQVSAEPTVEAAREILSQLELSQGVDGEEIEYEENEDDDEDEEDEEDEEEFSFVCPGDDAAQIAAEDAFFNGQIRPVYPLFNRDLLLGASDFEGLDEKPPVGNVFVETGEVTSSGNDDADAEGLSCEWSGKAVAAAGPDGCKKSNSTGFSKFWRFRDLLHRSNSDGRDAFVFLNNPAPSTSAAGKTEEKSSQKKHTGKAKVNGDTAGEQKKKKSKKQLSAHERYMKSKAKDEDRRRSYLPYRPELVGFFTNVKGGLTRNVHPF
ncbi:PREDICTED: uncharacterized protein LOC109159894 [Ipomoea nil]|uniref:uncharacterized protein LOC109159894 n=1 Tax=Ipomoea nil TaxID=35883 RepID=UPI0009019ABE|nr:PREDICTED: uncharacterized protein LOC109159894 [Ipomoea nil]